MSVMMYEIVAYLNRTDYSYYSFCIIRYIRVGTTTSTMAPVASRIIITDSSIASDANAPPWSLHDSDTQDKTLISTNT